MLIREAYSSDKPNALEFCQNTFSWGDYVQYTWDSWLKEEEEDGELLVLEDKGRILGFCHLVFFPKFKFAWIEGIRTHPDFRRTGLASRLVQTCEGHTQTRGIGICYMLIDDSNNPSVSLAAKLNYSKIDTWAFFTLPNKSFSDTKTANIEKNNDIPTIFLNGNNFFVKSWRWFPLTQTSADDLIKEQKLITTIDDYGKDDGNNDNEISIAILQDSEHFEKTMLVTIISKSKKSSKKLLQYIQNYGFKNSYQRIQVLSKHSLPELDGLKFKTNFSLFKKIL